MDYETISFEALRPYLAHEFKNESQMLKAIERVGKLFNHYRENLSDYREDPELVSAYCAYYLTTNYPKLFEVEKLLGGKLRFEDFNRIIDIGTGPGTFLLALDKICDESSRLEGVDISQTMLDQAARILEGLAPGREFKLGKHVSPRQEGDETLLIFTHSLNEMPLESAANYIEKVRPKAILLIEPGTKEVFSRVLELRKFCIDSGMNVQYPCFSNGPCPLNLEEDWCHQFIQVKQADDVESMTQKLHRNRRLLPLTVQLYTRSEATLDSSKARLVRVKRPTKHSLEWQLCEANESSNQVFDVEVPKRGLSKRQIKEAQEIMAGEEVEYEVSKALEGKTRIRALNIPCLSK